MKKFNNFLTAFFYIFLLSIPLSLWLFGGLSYQITDQSFEDLQEINQTFERLKPIEKLRFEDEEKLKFEVNKLIDPAFFGKYYALEYHIYGYVDTTRYRIDIDQLSKEVTLENLDTNYFANKDSVINIIEDIDHKLKYVPNTYIEYHYQKKYCIQPIDKLQVPKRLIKKLYTIKNKSFGTNEEISQELKNLIGLEEYKIHGEVIEQSIDNTSTVARVAFIIYICLFITLASAKVFALYRIFQTQQNEKERDINEQITKAQNEISSEPNRLRPAWDLAHLTLQKYFNKNISQVNSIYRLSIAVMLIGFFLIVTILIGSIFFEINFEISTIGVVSGIITEFIGATFLFVYRSTVKQAIEHSKSLEDINKVGMSIKIIESIEQNDSNESKITDAKLEVAKKLIDK